MPQSTPSISTQIPARERITYLLLHPLFALTAIAEVVTGPLLPAIAPAHHLSDQSTGLLLFFLFAGASIGSLFVRKHYTRLIRIGFYLLTLTSLGMAFAPHALLFPAAFVFGISTGLPMTAINLYVGRGISPSWHSRRAASITFLNFSWSAGAMLAPMLAVPILAHFSYRAVYIALSFTAAIAVAISTLAIHDHAPDEEADIVHASVDRTASPTAHPAPDSTKQLSPPLRIALFAIFFFLLVGVENAVGSWIPTYLRRTELLSLTLAAISTSIFWGGNLFSRGVSSLILLRVPSRTLLRICLVIAVIAASLMLTHIPAWGILVCTLILGLTLAPIFPIMLATFLDSASHSSETRYVLAFSGFGGSVLSWLTGLIAGQTHSLRLGLITIPITIAALLFLAAKQKRPS